MPSSRPQSTESSSEYPPSPSSVKKELMQLQLNGTATVEDLYVGEPPVKAAADILIRLVLIAQGRAILPESYRTQILDGSSSNAGPRALWDFAFTDGTSQDALPGRIPSLEEMLLIDAHTKKCSGMQHEKLAWNLEVHHQLLAAVFRQPSSTETLGSFDVSTCASAWPDRRWLPPGCQARVVDFCLYADFSHNSALDEAQMQLCNAIGSLTINHTSFTPLQLRPIVLSIETEEEYEPQGKAELQMVVWHSAQWAFLREAVRCARLLHRQATGSPGRREEGGREEDADSGIEDEEETERILAELPFLPGIIISGHQWRFVLSTREKGKYGYRVRLWSDCLFGSTRDLRKGYQVVAGLREIAAWVDRVYVSWFKRYLLGFE